MSSRGYAYLGHFRLPWEGEEKWSELYKMTENKALSEDSNNSSTDTPSPSTVITSTHDRI